MPSFRSLALAACVAWLAACTVLPETPATAREPAPLLLVSIDGFHPDYLRRGRTPNLARLASEGVRARWMNPSYPSLTFPNHYTLVTGLRPDRHGIVHNTMHDAELGGFRNSDAKAVREPRWWGGEPLWVTAEKHGLRTATMFWPGSEAPIGGSWPTDWLPYDDRMPAAARIDRVLQWLDRAGDERPRLITLYFSALDRAGHDAGPESAQTDAMLADIDAAFARLLGGLSRRGLRDRVNLVVVSDHGMATVPPGHSLNIESLVDGADASYVSSGEVLGFMPRPGRTAAAEARLLGRHAHHQCWRKGELPPRWRYGTHARVPPIVCQMDVGWEAITPEKLARRTAGATRGSHGYDPADPSMRALFIAHGPAFRRGIELPPFDNVDVYPLLSRLLGMTPRANDGNPATLEAALRQR